MQEIMVKEQYLYLSCRKNKMSSENRKSLPQYCHRRILFITCLFVLCFSCADSKAQINGERIDNDETD